MKQFSSICTILFWANSLFAQNDSSFFKNIIVKINPTLIGTGFFGMGEYGGIIQFPVQKIKGESTKIGDNIDAFIGGGYNINSDGYSNEAEPNCKGFTIRTDLYFYQKKHYFSLQFSFRRWHINGIYGIGTYDAETEEDNIISPSTAIFDYVGDLYFYTYDNAIVNVYSIDILYGVQFPRHRKPGRLFFELFIGAGIRFKDIVLEELEKNDPNNSPPPGMPGKFYPLNSPIYSSESELFPDLKLGFMVGFIL